jgi:hypothetical protein
MEYEPEGFVEKAGDALGIPLSEVEGDLNRFGEFMEKGGTETGPRKGVTEPLEPSGSTEPAITIIEVDTSSVEQPAGQKLYLKTDRYHQQPSLPKQLHPVWEEPTATRSQAREMKLARKKSMAP